MVNLHGLFFDFYLECATGGGDLPNLLSNGTSFARSHGDDQVRIAASSLCQWLCVGKIDPWSIGF
jgi:hypothetical protein